MNRQDKASLPEISRSEVFPDNQIEQQNIEREDGLYQVSMGQPTTHVVHVKDKKMVQYDVYHVKEGEDRKTGEVEVYLSWTFDYDDAMSIYREFPSLGIKRTIFYDKPNGRYDKDEREAFFKRYNAMTAEVLSESMQKPGYVTSVEICKTCRASSIAHCEDGDTIYFCDHHPVDKEKATTIVEAV